MRAQALNPEARGAALRGLRQELVVAWHSKFRARLCTLNPKSCSVSSRLARYRIHVHGVRLIPTRRHMRRLLLLPMSLRWPLRVAQGE